LTKENALGIIKKFDVVVDATDNFSTRYLINDACVLVNKPFVYGALHDFEGQVSVFNHKDGPTYRCLFPNMPRPDEIPNCNENGVLGVLPGIIGSLQALETIKVLTGIGEVLAGKLLIFNGLTQENRLVQFRLNPENKNIERLADSYGFSICPTKVYINADTFLELKSAKQIIDVRSQKEFAENHLKNALNIPLPTLEHSLDNIDLDREVYLVCQSGKRSERAAQKLLELAPKAMVFSVEGGMNQISALCH
jgi:adenylyltransferase/sulfurtransferase